MEGMLAEIKEIPERAKICYDHTKSRTLPGGVPYLGMGSSYYAPLVLKYLGQPVIPEIASEYYYYLSRYRKQPLGVLISQSGRSTETLWCKNLFDQYIAIVNDTSSPLVYGENMQEVVPVLAGREIFSSTKTYVNTLITLYNGFGIDPKIAIQQIRTEIKKYEETAEEYALVMAQKLKNNRFTGFYVIGNGPNIATALQSALTISETTKLSFNGMAVAQYDHGPKETAANSMVIAINVPGAGYERTCKMTDKIRNYGAETIIIEEKSVEEVYSPITIIVHINLLTYYLARELEIKSVFTVGGKVTEVD